MTSSAGNIGVGALAGYAASRAMDHHMTSGQAAQFLGSRVTPSGTGRGTDACRTTAPRRPPAVRALGSRGPSRHAPIGRRVHGQSDRRVGIAFDAALRDAIGALGTDEGAVFVQLLDELRSWTAGTAGRDPTSGA